MGLTSNLYFLLYFICSFSIITIILYFVGPVRLFLNKKKVLSNLQVGAWVRGGGDYSVGWVSLGWSWVGERPAYGWVGEWVGGWVDGVEIEVGLVCTSTWRRSLGSVSGDGKVRQWTRVWVGR